MAYEGDIGTFVHVLSGQFRFGVESEISYTRYEYEVPSSRSDDSFIAATSNDGIGSLRKEKAVANGDSAS